MLILKNKPIFVLLLSVVLLAIVLFRPESLSPSGCLTFTVGQLFFALDRQMSDNGLSVPDTMDEYYSSVVGSPYRCLTGKVRLPYSATLRIVHLEDVCITIKDTPDEIIFKAESRVVTRKWFLFPKSSHEEFDVPVEKLQIGQRTKILLESITQGTKFWSTRVYRAKAHVVGAKAGPVPAISFDRPATQKEVDEYLRWLDVMVSSSRIRDDWGNPIRLTIENEQVSPVLTAASAGPDGKWGTEDDLVFKRDVKLTI